ncbi:hypothetical protein MRB53_016048 [Persea americana]|uniref:Uncharacterized protein n=1 Tax=Persea americana TaxID=3435 RepID=A0ACC2M0Y2_PERAE|nr:hypothetical protein MRB53_016048 [Persea americana]
MSVVRLMSVFARSLDLTHSWCLGVDPDYEDDAFVEAPVAGEGVDTVGAHMEEEGNGIAVGGEDVLVGVGWGGRRELVEGDDEGEDDKSGDKGLHLKAALRQGGGGGSSFVFSHR